MLAKSSSSNKGASKFTVEQLLDVASKNEEILKTLKQSIISGDGDIKYNIDNIVVTKSLSEMKAVCYLFCLLIMHGNTGDKDERKLVISRMDSVPVETCMEFLTILVNCIYYFTYIEHSVLCNGLGGRNIRQMDCDSELSDRRPVKLHNIAGDKTFPIEDIPNVIVAADIAAAPDASINVFDVNFGTNDAIYIYRRNMTRSGVYRKVRTTGSPFLEQKLRKTAIFTKAYDRQLVILTDPRALVCMLFMETSAVWNKIMNETLTRSVIEALTNIKDYANMGLLKTMCLPALRKLAVMNKMDQEGINRIESEAFSNNTEWIICQTPLYLKMIYTFHNTTDNVRLDMIRQLLIESLVDDNKTTAVTTYVRNYIVDNITIESLNDISSDDEEEDNTLFNMFAERRVTERILDEHMHKTRQTCISDLLFKESSAIIDELKKYASDFIEIATQNGHDIVSYLSSINNSLFDGIYKNSPELALVRIEKIANQHANHLIELALAHAANKAGIMRMYANISIDTMSVLLGKFSDIKSSLWLDFISTKGCEIFRKDVSRDPILIRRGVNSALLKTIQLSVNKEASKLQSGFEPVADVYGKDTTRICNQFAASSTSEHSLFSRNIRNACELNPSMFATVPIERTSAIPFVLQSTTFTCGLPSLYHMPYMVELRERLYFKVCEFMKSEFYKQKRVYVKMGPHKVVSYVKQTPASNLSMTANQSLDVKSEIYDDFTENAALVTRYYVMLNMNNEQIAMGPLSTGRTTSTAPFFALAPWNFIIYKGGKSTNNAGFGIIPPHADIDSANMDVYNNKGMFVLLTYFDVTESIAITVPSINREIVKLLETHDVMPEDGYNEITETTRIRFPRFYNSVYSESPFYIKVFTGLFNRREIDLNPRVGLTVFDSRINVPKPAGYKNCGIYDNVVVRFFNLVSMNIRKSVEVSFIQRDTVEENTIDNTPMPNGAVLHVEREEAEEVEGEDENEEDIEKSSLEVDAYNRAVYDNVDVYDFLTGNKNKNSRKPRENLQMLKIEDADRDITRQSSNLYKASSDAHRSWMSQEEIEEKRQQLFDDNIAVISINPTLLSIPSKEEKKRAFESCSSDNYRIQEKYSWKLL